MSLVVQKYGGSSVGSVERILHVAARIGRRKQDGGQLAVVVSAMQGETDRLLSLAHAIDTIPDPRETDALLATGEQASAALVAMALRKLGVKARSLTGTQMRVRATGAFTRARIHSIDRGVIERAFADDEVVVATGFQGVDDGGNTMTLGRGGSDTSAVALAAALGADECEIYTDVLGVYTADPSVCQDARKLDVVFFDEMMEMASAGAKVLQIRSVELAMNHGIPIRVRSTFSDDPGTLVTGEEDAIERLVVRGVSHDKNEVKMTLRRVPDRPGIAAQIFSELAREQINVDVIVQNMSESGTTDLSFTCGRADRHVAEGIVRRVAELIAAQKVEVDEAIGKVSIVGVGMRSHPGVAATMFEALSKAGINIQMITTSEIKVTCVVDRTAVEEAVRVLHGVFELGNTKASRKPASSGRPAKKARTGAKKAKKKNKRNPSRSKTK